MPPQSEGVNAFVDRSFGKLGRMGRKAILDDAELRARVSDVFREVGYDGATLALLSEATGLQKASLYHRFPNGKEEMATEVLRDAGAWLETHVLAPLRAPGPVRPKLVTLARRLDEFYAGGRQACLLNRLAASHVEAGPFTALIKGVFEAWGTTVSRVLSEAGVPPAIAKQRAQRAMILLQGTLVYARGVGSTRPFKAFLKGLPDELLEGTSKVRAPGR